jgi:hypothetical protein
VAAIAGISIDQINALNSTQGSAFVLSQIQGMTADQVNALIGIVNV